MAGEVIVYSTPFCVACERLKAYLKGEGVAFTVKDPLIDPAVADHLTELGVLSAPALEVDVRIHAGPTLKPETIDALLGL